MASILIAEDDRLTSIVMIEVLERSGFTVLHANDGAEAIKLLTTAESPVEVAIIDLVMPNVDGVALLAFCRQHFPDISIIVTSGFSEAFVETRLKGLRADAFLPKPWRVEVLVDTITRLLPKSVPPVNGQPNQEPTDTTG